MKLTSIKSLMIAMIATLGTVQSASAESVMAVVNGNMIMESQVLKALGKKANTEENRKAALETIIDDTLVQEAIKKSGVKVDWKRVDQAVEEVAARNGLTYGQLLDALDYQRISLSQFKNQIAQQMMMEAVRHDAIGQSIQVAPEQVQAQARDMLEKDKAAGKVQKATGQEYRISHILIKTTPILDDVQAKAKLTQLVADINAGKISFEDAAKANSVDYASAADGGDLGFNFLDIYDPTFAQVAAKTSKSQISAPFKSQFGWHVLKVTDLREGDRTEDAYAQKAYEQLVNQQAQEASKDWVKALRKTAEIQYVNGK